jgi:hypothetical protein
MTGITDLFGAALAFSPSSAGDFVFRSAEAMGHAESAPPESAGAMPKDPDDSLETPPAPYPGVPVEADSAKPRSVTALLEWIARVLAERPRMALAMQARTGPRKAIELLG